MINPKTLRPHQRVFGAGYHAGVEAASSESDEPLVGNYFHSFTEGGALHWQGKVVSRIGSDHFVVQLYSWMDGRETDRVVFPFARMVDWTFYPSAERMNDAYERAGGKVTSNKSRPINGPDEAPDRDLLAACEVALLFLEEIKNAGAWHFHKEDFARETLRAAVAKAKGEAP